mmetsp:Transcript_39172/g.92692  ORF Transcript_39172/g.92692 Transcript_39172/m.92692 type:complete len:376 (-) Transcript_39172:20-1147(-)
MSLRRGMSYNGDATAEVETTDTTDSVPTPQTVKAAFRASVVGGGRFARSEMGFGKKVNRRNSMSMLEPGPMAWQSLKSLDSFLEDAKEEKLKPKLRVRDDSVDDFFSVVKSSFRLAKGNSLWSQHAGKTSLAAFSKTLDSCNAILKDIFSHIPLEKLSEEVHLAFLRLDKDGTGELDEDEMRDAFDEFGLRLDAEEVRGLMERYDASRSGTLDCFEFEHMVRIMLGKPCEPDCPACKDPKYRNTTGEDTPSPTPEEEEESCSPAAKTPAELRGGSLLRQMQAELEREAEQKLAAEREVQRLREEAEREAERLLQEEQWREKDARAVAGMRRDLLEEALQRSTSREEDPAYLVAHPDRAPRLAAMVRRIGRRVSDG